MKAGHPIRIDRARANDPAGGSWETLDAVSRARVQILPARRDPISQALSVMGELQRLAALAPNWDWSRCAVIAREWDYLAPVRAFCELHEIPSQMGNEEISQFRAPRRATRAFETISRRSLSQGKPLVHPCFLASLWSFYKILDDHLLDAGTNLLRTTCVREQQQGAGEGDTSCWRPSAIRHAGRSRSSTALAESGPRRYAVYSDSIGLPLYQRAPDRHTVSRIWSQRPHRATKQSPWMAGR